MSVSLGTLCKTFYVIYAVCGIAKIPSCSREPFLLQKIRKVRLTYKHHTLAAGDVVDVLTDFHRSSNRVIDRIESGTGVQKRF